MKHWDNFMCELSTLFKTLLPKILVKLLKRAKDKVLKVKLIAKFDLYGFIPAKATCLEMPGLDLARNTL